MENVMVDTKFLMDKLGKPGWVLVDVSFAADYEKGHIPGAVGLPAWVSKMFAVDTKRHSTVIEQLEQMFGEMGIGSDSHIIVYGNPANVHWNAVPFWILEAGGFNSTLLKGTVQFYDGGVKRWQAEGGKLEQGSPRGKPAAFKSVAGVKRGATADEVLSIAAGKKKAIGLGIGQMIPTKTAVFNFWVEPQVSIADEGPGWPQWQTFLALNTQFK
jgi:3-mercaptopyruvate sulfurtransferase SseA